MKSYNSTLLAQLTAEELRSFYLLDFTFDETPYRYTSCDVPLLYNSNVYNPIDFRISRISYSMNRFIDKMQLELTNLDQQIQSNFVGGTPRGESVILRVAVTDDKGTILDSGNAAGIIFDGEIDDWTLTETGISVSVTGLLTKWTQTTLMKHSPSCRWKKFKGTECGYSGSETWCDRTNARCRDLGNGANFGGFRWLPSIINKEIWWGSKPPQDK